jgi:hypothetical protein
LGGADKQDPMLERIADNTGQVVLPSNIAWHPNILTRRDWMIAKLPPPGSFKTSRKSSGTDVITA